MAFITTPNHHMPNEFGSHVKAWNAIATKYDRMTAPIEGWVLGPSRRWLAERVHGQVLEIGIGTGINLEYLPDSVGYTGTDVSPAMIALAQQRSERLGREVNLDVVDATSLPYAENSFDCVLSTYVLCCVPDEHAALAEALRVLRPGGSLLLANHIASDHRLIRWFLKAVDTITVPRMGEHFSREPLRTLRDLDAEILETQYSLLGIIERIHAKKSKAPSLGQI